MLKLNLHVTETGKDTRVLSVPTKVSEIDIEYLKAITADVKPAKHHALVAYIVRGSFIDRFTNTKQKDTIAGAFMLISKNDPNDACSANVGEMLIASPTDIMRGYEVTVPKNALSERNVFAEINKSDSIVESSTKIKRNTNPYLNIGSDISTTPFFTVGFKIVPLTDIHGSYDKVENVSTELANKYYTNE